MRPRACSAPATAPAARRRPWLRLRMGAAPWEPPGGPVMARVIVSVVGGPRCLGISPRLPIGLRDVDRCDILCSGGRFDRVGSETWARGPDGETPRVELPGLGFGDLGAAGIFQGVGARLTSKFASAASSGAGGWERPVGLLWALSAGGSRARGYGRPQARSWGRLAHWPEDGAQSWDLHTHTRS